MAPLPKRRSWLEFSVGLALVACAPEVDGPSIRGGDSIEVDDEPVEASAEELAETTLNLDGLGYASHAEEEVEDAGAHGSVTIFDRERACPWPRLLSGRRAAILFDVEGREITRWADSVAVGFSAASPIHPSGDPRNGLAIIGARTRKQRAAKLHYIVCFDAGGSVTARHHLPGVHHDVTPTGDGGLATLRSRALDPPEGVEAKLVVDDTLLVLDERGEEVAHHSLMELVHSGPGAFALRSVGTREVAMHEGIEYFHSNALVLLDDDQRARLPEALSAADALVTIRNQDVVVLLDLDGQETLWSWGRGELLGPHDGQLLESGNVLIFDNGKTIGDGGKIERGYSRVVEVDPATGEIVWQYTAPEPGDFYTKGRGSCQRLPGGNTLIGESDRGVAFEVTREGEVVWRWENPEMNDQSRRETFFRIRAVPE